MLKIGILALQGDIKEHAEIIKRCGAEPYLVRYKTDIDKIDGLIIPGGESTTIGKLLVKYELADKIRSFSKPIFGTCAGCILLAKRIEGENPHLSLLDCEVKRNAYGRQKFSKEVDIKIEKLNIDKFRAIFIRAPVITSVGKDVDVLSKVGDEIIFVKEKNLLACSFHPELTDDIRIHQYFLNEVMKIS